MVHLAVFLLTFSGLIFEIALTRIYSATIWCHFAFVAVSVALLGWGLGGFMLHLARRRVTASMDLAAGVTLVDRCLAILGQFPFRMDRLALYFLAPLVPFLLAGMALSMIFSLRRDTATSLYFAGSGGRVVWCRGSRSSFRPSAARRRCSSPRWRRRSRRRCSRRACDRSRSSAPPSSPSPHWQMGAPGSCLRAPGELKRCRGT